MAEQRLIDANALPYENQVLSCDDEWCLKVSDIEKAPTIDAVPVDVVKQIQWERDTAIKQLEEHGISFGCKADDVVKVTRCKDCTEWNESEGECQHWYGFRETDFCSYGERKDGGE